MKWGCVVKRIKTIKFHELWTKYSAACLILLVVLLFDVIGNEFWTLQNYESIVLYNTGLFISVVGLSFVMLGGGIDLSIGYQISMVSVAISLLSVEGYPDWIVIGGALLTGTLCGLLNGVLVGYLDIVPFAATIATQIIFRGCSYVLSEGRMVSNMAESIRQIIRVRFLGIRADMWLAMAAFGILWLILHKSYVGKYLRAIGLNEAAAERAGIKVKQIKCLSYCIASFFYAITAMVLTSKQGYAGSAVGTGMEITVISAAYVGGILNFPQKQGVITLLLGTLAVAIIDNGLLKVGMNTYIQYIITGIILIASMIMHNGQKNT